MSDITWEICIDWDCADWAGAHDFTGEYDDITGDVRSLRINRGKPSDEGIYPAAQLELVLNNHTGKYFITNAESPLYGKIRIWLPVRVRATYSETTYNIFYGYLNRITAYPVRDKQNIYFYATDGIDLLSKQILIQDMDDKTTMTDGDAIDEILDAGGWSATRRLVDYTGGDIINHPDTFTYEKA